MTVAPRLLRTLITRGLPRDPSVTSRAPRIDIYHPIDHSAGRRRILPEMTAPRACSGIQGRVARVQQDLSRILVSRSRCREYRLSYESAGDRIRASLDPAAKRNAAPSRESRSIQTPRHN